MIQNNNISIYCLQEWENHVIKVYINIKSILNQFKMSKVQAISFDEVDCGKKVEGSKRRFKWRFRIKGKTYNLQLASSALSGKKVVTLDSVELFSEKNLLNYNFDFMHKIEGHILRITRIPDNMNKYQMRIDNKSFDEIMTNSSWNQNGASQFTSGFKKPEVDPFSQFGSFVKSTKTNTKTNNQFGDFDFDSFQKPKSKGEQVITPSVTNKSFNAFEFGKKTPNVANYETVNFQTNNFQTNNFGDFAQNFSKVEKNLMDMGQQQFATNNFNKNNLYNDLMNQKRQQKSQVWKDLPPQQQKPKGFFADNEYVNSFIVGITGKQMVNKAKKTAQSLKNTFNGVSDSLI